jgi:hypothetical protein
MKIPTQNGCICGLLPARASWFKACQTVRRSRRCPECNAPLDFSDHAIAPLAKSWLEQGTAVELRAKLACAERPARCVLRFRQRPSNLNSMRSNV